MKKRIAPSKRISGTLIIVAMIFVIVGLIAGIGAATESTPDHLAITTASIEASEGSITEVATRDVVMRIELAGPPTCDSGTGTLAYGFLIDKDRDLDTGNTAAPASGIGADARITVWCNPGSGDWVSTLGTVTVNSSPSNPYIEIATTVAALPAVQFNWIAYAQENALFTRVPAAPDYQTWGLAELRQF